MWLRFVKKGHPERKEAHWVVSNTSDKDANNYNGLIHSDGCGVPSIKNPKKAFAHLGFQKKLSKDPTAKQKLCIYDRWKVFPG